MNREGNLDLTSLRIFIETAKDCNMTRAAAALGISQPAVSAAIKKIENSLGSPVFDRDTVNNGRTATLESILFDS